MPPIRWIVQGGRWRYAGDSVNGFEDAFSCGDAICDGAGLIAIRDFPTELPLVPDSSEYVRTAVMKETPVSGPIAASISHQERETSSSRSSLRSNVAKAESGEGKKNLFQILRTLH